MTLRHQLRNSLGSVFRPQDHILFSRLWTVPSGLVPRVLCLIASCLSIIINLFCGPCQGLLFFYSSCLLHFNIKCTLHLSSIYEKVLTMASKKEKIVKVVLPILTLSYLFLFLYLSPPLSLLLLITLAHIIPGLGYYNCQLNTLLDSNLFPLKTILCTVTRAIY